MKEISKEELKGLWKARRFKGCDFNENFNVYFRNDQVNIEGIGFVDYSFIDTEDGTKLLTDTKDTVLLELWMFLDDDTLIIVVDNRKFCVKKV